MNEGADRPMVEPKQCPQCGTALKSDALAGLCPACLLKQGVATDSVTGASFKGFIPPSVQELAPLFPQLEILELIGKGGMGAVYKARQKQLDRFVALKILPPTIGSDASFAERFSREARALAKLNHPSIVTIHDFGVAEHRPAEGQANTPEKLYFFIMEFVDGVTLRQLLNVGRVPAREALAIVPQICDALQFAHDHGIVHRDIKPENILLDRRGRVKVADFGLARLMDVDGRAAVDSQHMETSAGTGAAAGTPSLTEGKVMGTPNYMAPEQRDAPNEVDHRADIYALGVVFYQMLTGELPGSRIEPPSKKVQIDVRLDEVVLRALEKNPERRYEQASVLKTQVETIASSATPPPPPVQPMSAPAGPDVSEVRSRLRIPAIGLLLAGTINFVLLAIAGFFLVFKVPAGGTKASFASIASLPVLVLSVLVVIGAWQMLRVRSYALSVAASIFAIISPPSCLLGLPFGIWSLIVLSRRDVRVAFGLHKSVAGAKQHPNAGATSTEQRLSKTALFGAIVAILFFAWFLVIGGYYFQARREAAVALSAWAGTRVLILLLLPSSIAPFLTTLLGCIALAQIRRSGGRLYGLRLALFDALLFPLVLFVGLLMLLGGAVHLGGLEVLIISIPLCFVLVWLAWRAVRKPMATVVTTSPTGSEKARTGFSWKWGIALGIGFLVLAIAAVMLLMTGVAVVKPAAERAAAESRIRGRIIPSAPFIADYGFGTVELVAVAQHPLLGVPAWKPNGTPTPEPFPPDSGRSEIAGTVMRQLEFRVASKTQSAGYPVLVFDADSNVSSAGSSFNANDPKDPRRSFIQTFGCPPNTQTVSFKIGIPDGPWDEVITLPWGDSLHSSTELGRSDGKWIANYEGIRNSDGSVALSYNFSKRDDFETRMIGVNKDGSEVPLQSSHTTTSDGISHGMAPLSSKDLEKIKSIQLQRRPYNWGMFRNVSMQLGTHTTVEAVDKEAYDKQVALQMARTDGGFMSAMQKLFGWNSGKLSESPQRLRSASNPEVIRAGMENMEAPWAWQELERRAENGRLSRSEAEDIINNYSRVLRRDFPQGYDQPFHWIQGMLRAFDERGLLSPSVKLDFVQAVHGNGRLRPFDRFRETETNAFMEVEWRSMWHQELLGYVLLNEVTSVTVDDRPVKLRKIHRGWKFPSFHGEIEFPPLSPGKHVLRCVMSSALISKSDTTGLPDELSLSDWPPTKRRWTRTLETELQVIGENESVVQTVSDPELSPGKTGGLEVDKVFIRRNGKRGQATIVFKVGNQLKVPISFSASIILNGTRYEAGAFWYEPRGSSSSELKANVENLPPEVSTAEIVLTPDAHAIEHRRGVDRIWGETITFKDVPLVRHDLAK